MKQPRDVQLDVELRIGYVDYASSAKAKARRSERLGDPEAPAIVVDYGEADDVIGIELLDLDVGTLELAAAFAARHDLAFPHELRLA